MLRSFGPSHPLLKHDQGQPLSTRHRPRTAQQDAGDDDNRRSARNPSVRVSSGLVAMSDIPRVIRNAVDGARGQPPPAGYCPAVPVRMAGAHCWAPYGDVVSALRSFANLSLLEQEARDDARDIIRGLYQHPALFRTDVRFPEAAVFLSVDHGKFGQCMNRILKALQEVEAAAKGGLSQRTVTACAAFMEAVNYAAGTVTSAWPEEPGKPVLYDRAVFEESFQLTWTDARAIGNRRSQERVLFHSRAQRLERSYRLQKI